MGMEEGRKNQNIVYSGFFSASQLMLVSFIQLFCCENKMERISLSYFSMKNLKY